MKKVILLMLVSVGMSLTAQAQEQQGERRLVSEAYDEFNPHVFLQLQGGAAYSIGEAKFKNTLSPAAQLTVGYRFSKLFGVRLAVSGWQAKNEYSYPYMKYKWNYVQPNLDFMLDLSTLFAGWKANRLFNAYAFVGAGMPIGFNNDDAVNADHSVKEIGFEKLWDGTKVMWAARGGLGADIPVSKCVSLGLEVNANMLPDDFNSKKGKNDNLDWQINGLASIKIALGKTSKHHDAVYEYIEPTPAPKPAVKPEPEPEVEKPAPVQTVKEAEPMEVNVFFSIGKSEIRESDYSELDRLASYLKEQPETKVQLTGYADKDTGTKQINARLSRERAEAVKSYLVARGIAADRIATDAKGDTEQPFDTAIKNRVTIAVTK